MNHKLTTKHLIIGLFLDYMLCTGHYQNLIVEGDKVDIGYLKKMMVKGSEFPIYTPTNVLFLTIVLGMINNQVSLFNYLNNLSRDLDSKHWIAIVSRVLEIRAFGKENSSYNKSFRLFGIDEMCQKYPEFSKSVHNYIEEELFSEFSEVAILYPTLYYSSTALQGGEKQITTEWVDEYPIGDFYSEFNTNNTDAVHTLESYQLRHTRLLSLPFKITGGLNEDTVNFLLYSLSFYFIDVEWSSFQYLNDNYDV